MAVLKYFEREKEEMGATFHDPRIPMSAYWRRKGEEDRVLSTAMRKLKFLPAALEIAKLSKDRSTKVGALAMDDDLNILSVGYNGFPRGVNDDAEERHERPAKYAWTGHAEESAIAQAARNGVKLKGSTLLVTSLYPCARCARMIIQAGITTVLAPEGDFDPRWMEEWEVSRVMFQEAGVSVILYDPSDTETVKLL